MNSMPDVKISKQYFAVQRFAQRVVYDIFNDLKLKLSDFGANNINTSDCDGEMEISFVRFNNPYIVKSCIIITESQNPKFNDRKTNSYILKFLIQNANEDNNSLQVEVAQYEVDLSGNSSEAMLLNEVAIDILKNIDKYT